MVLELVDIKMNEGLRFTIWQFKMNVQMCIYYSRFSLMNNNYKQCKMWLEQGNQNIKFLEYFMNKKSDYNPYIFFEDISFDIDKDTGTKILQKYPNT